MGPRLLGKLRPAGGRLGLGHAFAGVINPGATIRSLQRHRAFAQPTPYGPTGHRSILAGSAVVADSEAQPLNRPSRALLARMARTVGVVPERTSAASCPPAFPRGCTVITRVRNELGAALEGRDRVEARRCRPEPQ
ncbi:hypothetical protein ABZT51_24560 [Streptomyces sp. NPDC005373]|uniref:hypothetical protein n=1 Tax=Streptomyces sp. NPDC005373 TaxID=3156879 RepID=UPI0033A78E3D